MGAVLGFFSTMVTTVFGAFATRLAAKIGINASIIAVWIASTAVFATALTTVGSALMVSMPAVLSDGFSILPSNTGTCIAAIFTGDAAAHVYRQLVIAASIKGRV